MSAERELSVDNKPMKKPYLGYYKKVGTAIDIGIISVSHN